MPKWAIVLIIVLAVLFVLQSTVILFHFANKKSQKKAESMADRDQSAVSVVSPQVAPFQSRRLQHAAQQQPMSANPAAMFQDPFFDDTLSSIGRLTQHMNQMMGGLMNSAIFDSSFMPAMDVEETPAAYLVRSDVPGLDKDKIDVTVRGNMLTIQGVRETGSEKKDGRAGYYSQERSYGSFSRSVMLPGPVDESNIKADYKNGVLTITLPKTQPDKAPSKIPVQ